MNLNVWSLKKWFDWLPEATETRGIAVASRSWRERWFAWRNGLLASQRFRRWASTFPLTRPIARRDERALFDLTAGFVFSQILLACVKLRLFDLLAAGAQPVNTIALQTELPEPAARRLLEAATSLRLLQRDGEKFALGRLGAVMVGNAGIGALLEHHAPLYQDLADPVAFLRGESTSEALAGYWGYGQAHRPADLLPEDVTGYSSVMSASQSLIAEEVLDAYQFERHDCLLDVAGGDGTFVIRAAQRAPQLRLMLFDLPAVAALARVRFGSVGLDRAQIHSGDFARDALPSGADLITLIRVLHDHDDERVRSLLRAIRLALRPQGALLVAEPMADTPGGESVAAYFNFYLLAMGHGRLRTANELTQMLHGEGFASVSEARSTAPQHVRVLMARCN